MAVRVDHVTLTANVVSTVDLTGSGSAVAVTIIDNASPVYFSVGTASGVPGTPADPTVGGDDFDSVPNSVGAYRMVGTTTSGSNVRVKCISAGTPVICVELVTP